MSIMWRAFCWLVVLAVLVCAVGGLGPADGGPLMRLGAIAFAVFLLYIMVRFELLLRSAARSGSAGRTPTDESGPADGR